MIEKIYWIILPEMKKFHAFTVNSGISKCKIWFVGFAKDTGDEWHKNYGNDMKCKKCSREIK